MISSALWSYVWLFESWRFYPAEWMHTRIATSTHSTLNMFHPCQPKASWNGSLYVVFLFCISISLSADYCNIFTQFQRGWLCLFSPLNLFCKLIELIWRRFIIISIESRAIGCRSEINAIIFQRAFSPTEPFVLLSMDKISEILIVIEPY